MAGGRMVDGQFGAYSGGEGPGLGLVATQAHPRGSGARLNEGVFSRRLTRESGFRRRSLLRFTRAPEIANGIP
jgi:hypothetical protein